MEKFGTLISEFQSKPLPTHVTIKEMGPRDGLQSESIKIETRLKISLINRLSNCGFTSIEVTSFVSPKYIPQFSDSSEVFQEIIKNNSISYPVLVPNMFGFLKAKSLNVHEICIFVSASESFSKRNLNCSIQESLSKYKDVVSAALQEGLKVRAYLSNIFACPFDGESEKSKVLEIILKLIELGCYEVSLGDTTGVGTKEKTFELISFLSQKVDLNLLAVHFHDTYGRALENILEAFSLGIKTADSSIAGLGGCPFAPGSAGNVSTEDLVFLLQGLRVETGIDLPQLLNVAEWFTMASGLRNRSDCRITKNDEINGLLRDSNLD
jgi:isopropylmalate/homocitrate/citramalate synthase